MKATADYRAVTTLQSLPNIATQSMFETARLGKEPSPIDMFIANTDEINQLYLRYIQGELPVPLGSLVLLGYMSAVESYIRAAIRRTVLIDNISSRRAAPLTLSFGAAYHHERDHLPDALLEGYSFSGAKKIADALKQVLDIEVKGSEMDAAIEQFSRICELRHCCVHRGGRLGSRNAINLGLDAHGTLLERPFRPSVDDLQGIADTLRTFVKTLNNFLFASVLERTVRHGGATVPELPWTWKWIWNEDKSQFMKYFRVFSSQFDSPPSPSARLSYISFAENLQPGGTYWMSARNARRAAGRAVDETAADDPSTVEVAA
jgi:hypothetical protein